MQIFARLTKVNESEHTVEGVIADETPDRASEVFDYATSKPHFQAWSEGIAKATDGKSLGNVRVMHGNTVAGVTKAIDFDDAAKAITVKAHIVDDNEWKKTLAGCYTGFSIGGRYDKKWDDGDLKRYSAIPAEYSLVDLPCNPGALFTVVKSDGSEEMRKFEATTDAEVLAKWYAGQTDEVKDALAKIAERKDVSPKEGEHKYGDVKFADAKKKKYPIDTAEHIRAAWNYINKPENADKYDAADRKTIRDKIIAAWKEKIDPKGPPGAEKAEPAGDLAKGAATPEELAMSEQLQKSLDDAKVELAKANEAAKTAGDALAKAEGDLKTATESLAKVTAERDDLTKAVTERDEALLKAAAHIEAQAALIEKMKDQPAALKIALTAIGKGQDVTKPDDKPEDKVLKRDGTVDEVATALRKALRNPVMVR